MSAPTNRNPSTAPNRAANDKENSIQTDPLSLPDSNNKESKPSDNNLFAVFNGPYNRFLKRYPIINQWKSRKAFMTAQGHVLCILFVAYILNNWPVSYPRNDNHNETMFWVMVLAMLAVTGYTLKHKKATRGVQLLSRAQTEEWKGWMQFMFIMYHYYRNFSIYNEIRVFVSAYVWMTGFGHFLYCDKKQDFSVERMISMWVRINYFPLMLSIFLNVKLELYYVVPLHTVGFFMTMATCYGAKLLREKRPDMDQSQSNMVAIGVCFLIHVIFFETSLFKILGWFSHEYEFRFATDKYSAWFGMLCGFLWSRLQAYMQWCYGDDDDGSTNTSNSNPGDAAEQAEQVELHSPQNKTQKPHKSPQKVQAMYLQRAGGVGLIAIWYFGFGTQADKHVYNPRHPFIFWMPLVGWLMIRNSSKYLTELHSTVLEFMGRITLETYVLQFHVFMCQNVQHIPVVIPGSGVYGYSMLKVANMLVTGAGFIALAYAARQATVVTQNAVSELVTDVMTKKFGRRSIGDGEDDRLMNTKPTLGIIEEPEEEVNQFQTPQKDKKDEES